MVFFISIFLGLLIIPLHLHHSLAGFFLPLHNWCINRIPVSASQEIIAAFMCGEKIKAQNDLSFFSRSGLFHLVIVSQVHLETLSLLLLLIAGRTKKAFIRGLLLLCLGIYILMVGPQAPLIRTGLFLGLKLASDDLRLGWSRLFTLMLATILSLSLNYEWYLSLSLLHSAGCACAFFIAQRLTKIFWQQAILAFIFTTPYLWGWANIHPLFILTNWVLAPPLMLLWMSASLLSFAVPSLNFIADFVIQKSIAGILLLLEPVPASNSNFHIDPDKLWTFFWGCGLLIWLWRRKRSVAKVEK